MSGKLKLKGHLKHLAPLAAVFICSADSIELSGLCDQHKSRSGRHHGNCSVPGYSNWPAFLFIGHWCSMILLPLPVSMNFWKKGFWRSLLFHMQWWICRVEWSGSNKVFAEITGRDQFYRKNVSTIFPDITADKLPVGSEKEITEISTQFGERIYRVSMAKGSSGRIGCTFEASDGDIRRQ